MTLHPVETSTSEPTRLEHWAHPIDAPTDPDTADVEAVADLGGLLPDWTNPDETTGAFEELPDRIEDSRSQATQPIPGLPDPGDWLPPVSAQDAEDAEDIEPTDHPAEVDTLPVLSPVGRGEAEDTAPVPTVRPPGRPPRRPG